MPPRNVEERRAARWYRLRGYRIVGTNVWAGGYELDVVARRGRRLVLCEVKSKNQPLYGDPLEMVTPEKQRRIRRAADAFLDARPDLAALDVSFEVIAVRDGRLERVPDAF